MEPPLTWILGRRRFSIAESPPYTIIDSDTQVSGENTARLFEIEGPPAS